MKKNYIFIVVLAVFSCACSWSQPDASQVYQRMLENLSQKEFFEYILKSEIKITSRSQTDLQGVPRASFNGTVFADISGMAGFNEQFGQNRYTHNNYTIETQNGSFELDFESKYINDNYYFKINQIPDVGHVNMSLITNEWYTLVNDNNFPIFEINSLETFAFNRELYKTFLESMQDFDMLTIIHDAGTMMLDNRKVRKLDFAVHIDEQTISNFENIKMQELLQAFAALKDINGSLYITTSEYELYKAEISFNASVPQQNIVFLAEFTITDYNIDKEISVPEQVQDFNVSSVIMYPQTPDASGNVLFDPLLKYTQEFSEEERVQYEQDLESFKEKMRNSNN